MSLKLSAGFCRRIGTGFRAGMDLLKLCERESNHGTPVHKEVMRRVTAQLGSGQPLARAMLDEGKYFPPLLIQMVHIGEETGRLERTLLEVADHYEHRIAMRRVFIQGISWPLLQLIAGIGVIGLMLLLIEALGNDFNPLGISLFQYIVLVILFFATITGCILAVRMNVMGCHRLYAKVYQVPKVGEALQTIALSRVCWTLSLALDSGLDAIRSIKMSLQSTQNNHFASQADVAVQKVVNGGTMSEAFEATGVFPEEFVQSIEVAEISGTDAESLGRLAKMYDERAKVAIRVLVGVMTGGIWTSITILMVFVILMMAMNIYNATYGEALKGL